MSGYILGGLALVAVLIGGGSWGLVEYGDMRVDFMPKIRATDPCQWMIKDEGGRGVVWRHCQGRAGDE